MSNFITALEGELSDLYRAEYKTMEQVFPSVYVFPTSKYNPIYPQNVILVGTKSEEGFSKEELYLLRSGVII